MTAQPAIPHAKPKRLSVENDGATLKLSWRWLNAEDLPTTLLIFIALLVLTTLSLIRGGGSFSLFNLIEVVCLYLCLATFFNTTTISVNHDAVTVKHGPLPYWGNTTVSSSAISQLYSQKNSRRRTRRWPTRSRFEIYATTKTGDEKLVNGHGWSFESDADFLYIESAIEHHLGITDSKVSSEIEP